MSFFGYLNSPVSIPPVYDTTPCLEHLMEYEDCVIDTGSEKMQFFMPTWPTLWPGLTEGANGMRNWSLNTDLMLDINDAPEKDTDYTGPLTQRQKQLLYECEEERMVIKACLRELIKLRRTEKHTSWDTAEAANLAFM
mmetsp:Transcript_5099/g.5821  ORF Transcript_5099/g.5821 Transcript_5099/m.5821 type:complete len:138 (+) Transcript_5099:39-452(+)|eukprot:CAMPEP_0205814914 /NCGR_PEP_ID=MMETSP0205-20121125/20322_1 /ASSEMBLY_ACC=CAM_ASM_000278 /TAXON_ID=36767 /ORGANISM="Euplotes focardii, Strain TN1" /LENGTH=137 /DNA_ID=CAMNT_0053099977 /DNA_START=12 /DNA_END=425 /DNA_ORIENTATION=-